MEQNGQIMFTETCVIMSITSIMRFMGLSIQHEERNHCQKAPDGQIYGHPNLQIYLMKTHPYLHHPATQQSAFLKKPNRTPVCENEQKW